MLNLFRSGRTPYTAEIVHPPEYFADILDQAPDALVATGVDGRVVRCNAAAAELVVQPSDELIGTPVRSRIVRGDREAPEGAARRIVSKLLEKKFIAGDSGALRPESGAPAGN